MPTIVEEYIKQKHQFIIAISGVSGSGKVVLSKNIARDFKFKLIDQQKFYKPDYNVTVKLPNEKIIINYDTDDIVDWKAFNKEVNENKNNGVVVTGVSFPTEKLEFYPDIHIHLKLPKQVIKQKRLEYIEKHKDKKYDIEVENLRLNMYTYPYYLTTLEHMKIDKTIMTADMSDDAIYDSVFDFIIEFVKGRVYVKSKKTEHSESSVSETYPDSEYYSMLYEDGELQNPDY